ncbi:NAD(P)H-dependent flavin oxidoreductase [Rhizobium sp. 10PS4]|uniref:NAD(P)H-dependent flavin oxidoreductase n=1 Tax=Rhizobium sp. 10PS4 TaxID=3075621 RepID=UPI0028FD1F21|nr:nitronate monooxygenase [Rhizobium sp. 10PS4]MDU0311894.1 nitronate monooxygenase [Rhizobium sp. 10PS4]
MSFVKRHHSVKENNRDILQTGRSTMTIRTRLTEFFNIEHPIILAPMTPAAGGALASAVADAGGLGLLGGGYADRPWYKTESSLITNERVGCGFITWAVESDLDLFDRALAERPSAMMLSFSDPAKLAARVKQAGVPLICMIHTLEHARRAIDVGADVLVVQGTEAGGHGLVARSTMPFVPSVVDLVAKVAPSVIVVAAGGIADGRGLAASLMLGADGVLMGTRFWATRESLIHQAAKDKVVAASGDETIRTSVYDIVRQKAWPAGYTGRLLKNGFIDKWHGREEELRTLHSEELSKVEAAWASGDYDTANVTVGEAVGLINDLPSAKDVVRRTVREASERLGLYAFDQRIAS